MEQKFSIDQKKVQVTGGQKISFRKLSHHFRCHSQMSQLPVDLFDQALRHLFIAQEPKDSIKLCDDREPAYHQQKWKVECVKGKEVMNANTEKRVCRKKIIRPIDRHSYGNKKQTSMEKGQKFPSQKALIQKQKLMPVTISEKEKSQIEIFRILKQNFTTQLLDNSRDQCAFIQSQVQKFKSCQQSRCLNNIAFNYDGSIMPLALGKKIKKQVIDCNCLVKQQTVIQPLNLAYKQASLAGLQNHYENGNNYKNIDQIGPQYVTLFEKIKWNPKITILDDSEIGRGSLKRESKNINIKRQVSSSEANLRFNEVQIKKKALDSQSIVKVANPQAYYEQLLIMPSRTKHKRSMSHDLIDLEKEVKNEDSVQNRKVRIGLQKKRSNLSIDNMKEGSRSIPKRSELCKEEKKEFTLMYRRMDRNSGGVGCYKKRFQKELKKKRKKIHESQNE